MSGVLSMMVGGSGFVAVTRSHTVVGSGTDIIPFGAISVTIEVWGGGGAGSVSGGNGGGGSGYCRSVYNVAGQANKTIAYTVPLAGTAGGNGANGTASSGTFAITTMTGGGGVGATAGGGGAGGTATGGNQANTTGNAGVGATPGAGITGVYGGPFGGGGIGGSDGHNGAVVFHYV